MSKIVFFDIDGTLLDDEKTLPASTKEAIEKLKSNGVYVAIATGRAPFMFKDLREELGIESYVSFNGQYVVFEGEVIYQNALNKSDLGRLLELSERNGHPLVYMNEKTMKASVRHNQYVEESLGTLKFPHPDEHRDFYKEREIWQTLLFCEEKDEHKYIEQFPNFRFIRWHKYSTDILPADGSKAEGIQKLIDRLGFDREDVYAFGDGLNDIEMIQSVGTGVAMGNSAPILKRYADYVTANVSEEGISKGLAYLKLI